MNWYKNNKDEWYEIIKTVSADTGKSFTMIEKDTVQSLFLFELANGDIPFVFKGGTSLSKAYGVIDRFSEDIDLSLEIKPTESTRKQAHKAIIDTSNKLGIDFINVDDVHSRFSYNKYVFEYKSLFHEINSEIIVETNFFTTAKPSEMKNVNCIIENYLEDNEIDLPIKFDAKNFDMRVQSLERTLVDKVFAVCDYRLENMASRDSRHLYDIAKILEIINIDNIDTTLISEVRDERSKSKNNPSANQKYKINEILSEIIESKFFAKDYSELTLKLLYEQYSYEMAVKNGIETIVNSKKF